MGKKYYRERVEKILKECIILNEAVKPPKQRPDCAPFEAELKGKENNYEC